jgi:hypothetical protein
VVVGFLGLWADVGWACSGVVDAVVRRRHRVCPFLGAGRRSRSLVYDLGMWWLRLGSFCAWLGVLGGWDC